MRVSRLGVATTALALSLLVTTSAQALNFNFVVKSGGNLAALQGTNLTLYNNVVNGFGAAGNLWSSLISDAVTVNVTIDLPSLGSGILGQASSASIAASYADVRTALLGDVTSADDVIATTNLQAGPSLVFVTNNTSGTRIVDNNASNNNNFLDVNRANAKALGLLAANDATSDADIEFSSNFSWDFDRSNGITSGTYDFVGVAAHEIGHALGFVSGVDTVDQFPTTDLNSFRVFSVLDLYRFSSNADTLVSGKRVQDLAYGGTPAFSLDGGATLGALFATTVSHGDGRQASHWKDNASLGIMDPTFDAGELGIIRTNDLRAFDAIGWNLTSSLATAPEPSTLALFAVGALLVRRRRRA